MSKNINQVFIANPITSNASTDLMYFGQSPYGAGNDAAMTYANFSAQFTLKVQTTKGDLIGFSTLPVRVAVGSNSQLLQSDSTAAAGISWTSTTFPTTSGASGAVIISNGTNWITSTSLWTNTVGGNGVLVQSNGTSNVYTTATYPGTTTINQILYSSAANTVTGLATANGGVLVTSNAGVPSILAGSGTTGTILQATSGGTPAWSSATYPTTTTINQILYSSAANTVNQITTANSATLITSSTGVPSFTASMTNGQVLIGSTGASPTPSTLTPSTGITITNSAASITISVNGATPVVDQTSSSVTMTSNKAYITDNGASLVTYTLPTSSAIGDWIEIIGKSSGGWTIAQAAGQEIFVAPTNHTTIGTGGSLSSVNQYDCVTMRCITANTTWVVTSQQSTGLTIV